MSKWGYDVGVLQGCGGGAAVAGGAARESGPHATIFGSQKQAKPSFLICGTDL